MARGHRGSLALRCRAFPSPSSRRFIPALRPSLDEVLAVRHERQAMVRNVVDALTDDQLASEVSCTEPGWPQLEEFSFQQCLRIVINEEWEHRLYAERDLTVLTDNE